LVFAFLLAGLSASAGRADIFLLHNGGQVRGELVNRDQSPRKTYVVKTPAGGQVTLDAEQVQEVKRQTAVEMQYDQIRGKYPDTLEGQWELAEWCQENRLSKQRRTHLERVIELDPEHTGARRALGYSHIQGRWVTQEQQMTENGYVRYKNSWVLPQEIEIKEQERKEKLAQLEWGAKLKRWHAWLNTDKAGLAQANIKAIDDPYAANPLAKLFNSPKQDSRAVRLLYVEALGRLTGDAGIDALVNASLYDGDEEIRLAALDQVVAHKYKPAVGKYVQSLKHKDNAVINRAAVGLRQMKDPSGVGPLIDALVTTHTFVIDQGQSGQTQAAFGTGANSGPGSFSFGGGGPKVLKQPIENRDVLQALVELTGGVSFNFDRSAWKYWYAAQKKPQNLDARRDSESK